jgi:hypothetical protein
VFFFEIFFFKKNMYIIIIGNHDRVEQIVSSNKNNLSCEATCILIIGNELN